MATNKNNKPNKDFTGITQTGLKALQLANQHIAVLKPRLQPDELTNLSANLSKLGALIPGSKQAHQESQSATTAQEKALTDGYALVGAIRQSVFRHTSDADTRRLYGVGFRASPRIVKDVKAAINQILDRANAKPEELASLGIVKSDIEELKKDMETIKNADDNQELKRANAPLSTRERNQISHTIIEAIGRISAAGALQFAKQPTERETFEALFGAGNPNLKKKKEGVSKAATKTE